MADPPSRAASSPTLEDLQHWTWVMGRAQQLMMEHLAQQMGEAAAKAPARSRQARPVAAQWPGMSLFADPAKIAQAQVDLWTEGPGDLAARARRRGRAAASSPSKADKDKRFAAPEWRDNPLFDMIRQSYLLISDRLLGGGRRDRGHRRQAARAAALRHPRLRRRDEPVQLRADQPAGARADDRDARRESAQGPRAHARATSRKGQLTHTDPDAFEVGRNIATTPGKVVKQTPLYQLIQYTPTTDEVLRDAAGHLPALDQPLLHPRSQPQEELHQLGGRPGADRVRRLLEIGRREHGRDDAGRLCPAPRSTRSTRSASCSASMTVHAIGYCVAGTDARRDAGAARGARRGGQGRERDLLHRPGRFLRGGRPQPVRRRRADEADPAAVGRQGLSRRPLHGRDLQPAARPRPDLELCRQQLPAGRGLSAVRPAPLERRHHQPAGQVAPGLSAATSTATTGWSQPGAHHASTARRSTSAR